MFRTTFSFAVGFSGERRNVTVKNRRTRSHFRSQKLRLAWLCVRPPKNNPLKEGRVRKIAADILKTVHTDKQEGHEFAPAIQIGPASFKITRMTNGKSIAYC
jgi:hypothetical protein